MVAGTTLLAPLISLQFVCGELGVVGHYEEDSHLLVLQAWELDEPVAVDDWQNA